ncbi:hypothetical protein [Phenylobacterium sp.]|uniref:hypothetical protein n=1 Tax=Phenylobacterium sp. TaxID=1871053 RepID=UPI0025D200CE|nr:hypothetical protein [Phenylobacterium sp.]
MQEGEIVLARLNAAFSGQRHDLAIGRNVSPDRTEWIEGLLAKGMDRLDGHDIDLLVFRAISTVGGVATFKFALARFLSVMIQAPAYSSMTTSDAHMILPKLEHAAFETWPKEERRAILEALELWADRRIIEATSEGYDPEAKAMLEWVEARRHLI